MSPEGPQSGAISSKAVHLFVGGGVVVGWVRKQGRMSVKEKNKNV